MPAALRAVRDGEKPPKRPKLPASMVDAVGGERRDVLVRARMMIARALDKDDVPAHALSRLLSDLERHDAEIRLIDDALKPRGEVVAGDSSAVGPVEDEPWDDDI